AIPSRNDGWFVSDRFWSDEKEVPHHGPRLVIECPCRPAFGDAGIVRRRPIVQRYVWSGIEVRTLESRRTSRYPTDKACAIPLPDGMENTRPWSAFLIYGGGAAPHNSMRHLNKGRRDLVEFLH